MSLLAKAKEDLLRKNPKFIEKFGTVRARPMMDIAVKAIPQNVELPLLIAGVNKLRVRVPGIIDLKSIEFLMVESGGASALFPTSSTNFDPQELAFEIEIADDSLKNRLVDELLPYRIGENLRPINSDLLKKQSLGNQIWLLDSSGNEISAIFESERLVRFYITFMGLYLESKAKGSIKFGHIPAVAREITRYDIDTVVFENSVPLEAKDFCIEIVDSSGMSIEHKNQIVERIQGF